MLSVFCYHPVRDVLPRRSIVDPENRFTRTPLKWTDSSRDTASQRIFGMIVGAKAHQSGLGGALFVSAAWKYEMILNRQRERPGPFS